MAKTQKSTGTVAPASTDKLARFLAARGISEEDTKEVTSSSWKWEDGVPKYFKVLGLPVQRERRPGEVKTPPFVAPVKDLESGDHCQLLVNTMLLNQFASYPPEQLIGKCFVSLALPPEMGKNYKRFETREVPDPEPAGE